MAYIVSSIPPFYSKNTSTPSPFYPSYNSPFFPSYATNTLPSPNHFYPFEASSPNLSFTDAYSPPTSYYNSNGFEHTKHLGSYHNSNYQVSPYPQIHNTSYEASSTTYSLPQKREAAQIINGFTEMAIPTFDGTEDGYWWILCVEKYFKARGTPEAAKVSEAVTALYGSALQWWLERQHHSSISWESFTNVFLWWFKPEFRDVLPLLEDGKEELNNKFLCSSFQTHTTLMHDSKEEGNNKEENEQTATLIDESVSTVVSVGHHKNLDLESFSSNANLTDLVSNTTTTMVKSPSKASDLNDKESLEIPPPKTPERISIPPPLLLPPLPLPLKPPDRVSPSPVPSPKPPDPSGRQAPTEFQSTPSRLPPLKPPDRSFSITVQAQPWVTPTPTLPPPEPPDDVVVLTPTPSFLPDSKHRFQNFNATLSKFGLIFSVLYKPTKPCPTLFDSQRIFEMQSQPLASRTIHVLPCDPLAACHVYVPFLNFWCPLHSNIPAKAVCICCLTIRVRSNSFVAVLGEMTNQSVLPLLQKAIVSSFMKKKVGPCDAYKTSKSLVEYPLVTQFAWPMHHSISNVHHKRAHLSFQYLQVSTKLVGLPKFGWLTTFKTWDPGENSIRTIASSLQFKKWDPGKFVVISIFLQP